MTAGIAQALIGGVFRRDSPGFPFDLTSSKIFFIIKREKRMHNDKKRPFFVITVPESGFYDNKDVLHYHGDLFRVS